MCRDEIPWRYSCRQIVMDSAHKKRSEKSFKLYMGSITTSEFFPTEALKRVYYGLVHAKLTYCISCWGGAKNLKKLDSLQNRAVEIICKAKKRDSPKLCYYKTLQVRQSFNLQIATINNVQIKFRQMERRF